jgi:hypothetical protein
LSTDRLGGPVFKTATWTRRNRRLYDVVSRLADRAGTPLDTEIETAETADDLAFLAVHETGYQLLIRSVIAFSSGFDTRRMARSRKQSRLFGALTPDSGERGCVFLTHAAAAMLARTDPLGGDRARVEALDEVVREVYPWPDEDAEFVRTAMGEARRADSDPYMEAVGMAGYGYINAGGVLSVRALELAAGKDKARSQPAFKRLGDIELVRLFGDIQNAEWRLLVDDLLSIDWQDAEEVFAAVATLCGLPRD